MEECLPFKVNREGLSLSNPTFMPPMAVLGDRNPMEAPAARLAAAVARAGWDIPGTEINVRFSNWPSATRSVISSIAFGKEGDVSTVHFDNTQRDGTYAACSFTAPDGKDVSRYDDGSGRGTIQAFNLVHRAALTLGTCANVSAQIEAGVASMHDTLKEVMPLRA